MKTLRALAIATLALAPSLAWGACPSPFTAKDAAGATQNLAEINDASNNCVFPYAITDGGGAANRATVEAASTTPAATDPALAVALSPNSLGCAGASIANTTIKPISITANASVITAVSGKQIYLCAISLIIASSESVSIVEGATGGTCGSGTAAIIGATTAANGLPLSANGGLTFGNGVGVVGRTATANHDICIFKSGSSILAGSLTWAQY